MAEEGIDENAKRLDVMAQASIDERLFRAIGEFVVRFEHAIGMAAFAVQSMLEHRGLDSRRLSGVVVANLTADPTLDIFFSLAAEVAGAQWDDADRLVVKRLRSRAQELVKVRNDIVHSQWIVGWGGAAALGASDADGRSYPARRYGRDKGGLAQRSFEFSPLDIEVWAGKAMLLGLDLMSLSVAVIDGDRPVDIVGQLAQH